MGKCQIQTRVLTAISTLMKNEPCQWIKYTYTAAKLPLNLKALVFCMVCFFWFLLSPHHNHGYSHWLWGTTEIHLYLLCLWKDTECILGHLDIHGLIFWSVVHLQFPLKSIEVVLHQLKRQVSALKSQRLFYCILNDHLADCRVTLVQVALLI